MGREPTDGAPLVGSIRGGGAGGSARPLPSASAVSPPDARRDRSPGARAAPGAPVLGGAAAGPGVGAQAGYSGPSESAVYRCLLRAGVDDHSRFCVSARLMPRERTQLVCDGFLAAMRAHGVPQQVLTDNGKVFTGKYAKPPVDVLFDRLCRENGIDHLLTQPASPTTTGKIERFHRTLRIEFDTRRAFASLAVAQQALDESVTYYNTERPHQALGDAPPVSRFQAAARTVDEPAARPDRTGEHWVTRKVSTVGMVCVGYQQVCIGQSYAGSACDVLVTDGTLQYWVGNELVKTVARQTKGEIRKKHADGTAPSRVGSAAK